MSAAPKQQLSHRVLVYTPYGLQYFREALLGIRGYGFETGTLTFINRWSDTQPILALKNFIRLNAIEGIITAVHDHASEKKLLSLPIPVVNISNTLSHSMISTVTQDDFHVGQLAAQHLLKCGCQSFGFWGQINGNYSHERLTGFRKELELAGLLHTLQVGEGDPLVGKQSRIVYQHMKCWLLKQPRPLGVFSVLDSYAIALLRAAKDIGWRVPEDMAVLGAGNDDLYVQFEDIPLSSVELPARRIGYEAARLLRQMITRQKFSMKGIRLPVHEIAARKSSDILYVKDQAVSRAARYIRDNAVQDIYLQDIVQASGVCRTVLQKRFRVELGRSILDEILRIRIGIAQSLLARTDLPITLVAERSGFANSQRLSLLFHRATGLSPRDYRKKLRSTAQ